MSDFPNTTTATREKKELVSLSGRAVTLSGAPSKSQYFDFLATDLDDYTDLVFTEAEARSISNHIRKLSTGASAMIPMYCGGDRCPVKNRCPLWQIGKAPVGRQCLLEVELLKNWIVQYMNEYDVDPSSFTEVGYVSELAELMVLEMRLNIHLANAENASLITDQTVGVDREGDPIIQKQISPFMEQKERIQNRRSKIIKLMVGDRQEQYKKEAALKIKLDKDPSSKYAEMRTKLENLDRKLTEITSVPVESSAPVALPASTAPGDLFDE